MKQTSHAESGHDVQEYYRTIAPFYDAELKERGDEAFWSGLGRSCAGGWVLELGAGSGRVSRLLAHGGGRVVAVDISPEMLRLLREKTRGSDAIWPVLADMRRLALRRHFDVVVAADDPFSHLTDAAERQEALRRAAEHLRPGGRFVLDALWLSPARERERTQGQSADHSSEIGDRTLRVHEHWQCDPRTHCCQAEYAYAVGERQVAVAEFAARYWTEDEVRSRLSEAGLWIEQWWGGYNQEPWDPSTSEHLVVVASRMR